MHGTWYITHLFGANGAFQALGNLMRLLSTRFTCAKCSIHTAKYLETHPLPDERSGASSRDLFQWTVDFHNMVTTSVREEAADPLKKAADEKAAADSLTTYLNDNPFPSGSTNTDICKWARNFGASQAMTLARGTAPRSSSILTKDGADALFSELTTGADEDLKVLQVGGSCHGCDIGSLHRAPSSKTGLVQRFVPR